MKGSGNKLSCLVFVVFVLGGKWATVEILLFGFGVRRWRPAVGLRGVWKELFGRLSLLLTPLDGGGFGGMLTVLIGPEAVWAYVRSSGTSWELDPPFGTRSSGLVGSGLPAVGSKSCERACFWLLPEVPG